MIYKLNLLRIASPILLAAMSLALFGLLPVAAIGGPDDPVFLSSAGGAAPDLEISSDKTRLALAYYKDNGSGSGAIYLKSATASTWVTSALIGFGSNPQVAFKPGVNNIVYVVWVNGTGTAIQTARCTLFPTAAPQCVPGTTNVHSDTVNGGLGAPDVVVDSSNFLHVVWANDGIIESKRSTNADNVNNWPANPATAGNCAGNFSLNPVVGWTSGGNKLHLAFLCGGSTFNQAISVEYRRSTNGSPHSWTEASADFVIDVEINNTQTRLSNLAMVAGGSQVSLIWDGRRSGSNFSLMYAASTNEGGAWSIGPNYVPSGVPAATGPTGEDKLSTTSTVPPQEFGLRPSLVISGTNNAAVVWQARQSASCSSDPSEPNGSSDIFFAAQTTPISETLEHASSVYAIDPDLAVGSGNALHFVFMKDTSPSSCVGGAALAYRIAYRGPFTNHDSDQGEESNGVFLPIIIK
ncbi:MAG: hypothetical protein DPW09_03275 [Anaerolineae bacterium]|nr:hypothetical protein [Anaerolineales bacterium]MCQ3972452.1 hypothetical protein [Anaerolineae bacterium]